MIKIKIDRIVGLLYRFQRRYMIIFIKNLAVNNFVEMVSMYYEDEVYKKFHLKSSSLLVQTSNMAGIFIHYTRTFLSLLFFYLLLDRDAPVKIEPDYFAGCSNSIEPP